MKRESPTMSVIVPTFREGGLLERNLAPLRDDPRIEVIIADAEVVGRANRAFQMNWGAGQTGGEILIFLHADTRICSEDLRSLQAILQGDPAIVGGAFRFALDASSWKARVIEIGVRLRVWAFKLPYGDQALFIRRDLFEELGRYPDVPMLEDVFLIRKMKEKGRLLFFPGKAVTSARCWENHGYLKTTVINLTTMFLWKLGVSLESLLGFRQRMLSRKAYESECPPVSGNLETEPD